MERFCGTSVPSHQTGHPTAMVKASVLRDVHLHLADLGSHATMRGDMQPVRTCLG